MGLVFFKHHFKSAKSQICSLGMENYRNLRKKLNDYFAVGLDSTIISW